MSIDDFMEEVDVARSVVLDSIDKAFVSCGTKHKLIKFRELNFTEK